MWKLLLLRQAPDLSQQLVPVVWDGGELEVT